jgi:hypothetical protein
MKQEKRYLLLSRLYCRHLNYTSSCLAARGVDRRLGIAPDPEDSIIIKEAGGRLKSFTFTFVFLIQFVWK